MNEALARLPVTVLSGFLGAGKTTLLNHGDRRQELLGGAHSRIRCRYGNSSTEGYG